MGGWVDGWMTSYGDGQGFSESPLVWLIKRSPRVDQHLRLC